jgi:hypothetical protein
VYEMTRRSSRDRSGNTKYVNLMGCTPTCLHLKVVLGVGLLPVFCRPQSVEDSKTCSLGSTLRGIPVPPAVIHSNSEHILLSLLVQHRIFFPLGFRV